MSQVENLQSLSTSGPGSLGPPTGKAYRSNDGLIPLDAGPGAIETLVAREAAPTVTAGERKSA